jgi:hypothetical protein
VPSPAARPAYPLLLRNQPAYGPTAQFGPITFLRYYVELNLPAAQAKAALLDSPSSWLPALADGALERAKPLLAEVGVGPARLRVTKRVAVRLGEPVEFPSRLSLPMTWEPNGWLLPNLQAELALGPLSKSRTQLAISGRYEPPLGVVGRTVDRIALHRVAEATVKDFLDEVATVLQAPGPSPNVRTPHPASLRIVATAQTAGLE